MIKGISGRIKDLIIYLKAELYDFSYLQQNAFDKEDSYCPLKRQIPLFLLINRIFDTSFPFENHEKARDFFIGLRNKIKNMNFLAFESEEFNKTFAAIQEMLEDAQKV